MVSLSDRLLECTAIGIGIGSTVVTNLSPISMLSCTGIKTGARLGKAFGSFRIGGFYNPCFYLNSLSAGLGLGSFVLQTSSYTASFVYPRLAVPLYLGSQGLGASADAIDCKLALIPTFLF